MLPVIALVGQPNVGKSTIFNCLTKTRDALVYDEPGVTRDRQYGEGVYHGKKFILIDTGGLNEKTTGLDSAVVKQSMQAVEEADLVLFIVDGRLGLTPSEQWIVSNLRQIKKPVIVVVNKTEGIDADIACAEFYQLGLGKPFAVAASHQKGFKPLMDACMHELESRVESTEPEVELKGIKIALVGRPNVGKSTLTNRMLGEERVIVYDMPGTTRDSIYISLTRQGKEYTIIDTAGIRRKGRVSETLEKFSIVKTLQSISQADIAVLLIDAQEGLTDQDMHVLGFVLDAGRSLVIAVNKWDGLENDAKDKIKNDIDRRLKFVTEFVDVHFISAMHGTGVGTLFASVDEAYRSANQIISTSQITRALEKAIEEHNPPMVRGRRIKLRYAHMGGHNPPQIVIHGNQTESLPESYKRYLTNFFRKTFNLVGTPIKLELKTSDNPFKENFNKLTPLQEYKEHKKLAKSPYGAKKTKPKPKPSSKAATATKAKPKPLAKPIGKAKPAAKGRPIAKGKPAAKTGASKAKPKSKASAKPRSKTN
ncbi:MAG: ribosome biogenesis GTPase Der [Gammaproteobacteria bacterium]|nr:ribosome biogenesis GTPase Der [Gammaproteobacteria bacterium]